MVPKVANFNCKLSGESCSLQERIAEQRNRKSASSRGFFFKKKECWYRYCYLQAGDCGCTALSRTRRISRAYEHSGGAARRGCPRTACSPRPGSSSLCAIRCVSVHAMCSTAVIPAAPRAYRNRAGPWHRSHRSHHKQPLSSGVGERCPFRRVQHPSTEDRKPLTPLSVQGSDHRRQIHEGQIDLDCGYLSISG
jgi:hypothetical protein